MLHYKLQFGCLIILLYIGFTYLREARIYRQRIKHYFQLLLGTGIIAILLDMATVYSVNHLDTVPPILNQILHAFFLSSIDLIIFMLCQYVLNIAGAIPKAKWKRVALATPFVINEIVLFSTMHLLDYKIGKVTNYSMGIPAYTCYAVAFAYMMVAIVMFLRRWKNIEHHKRISIITYLIAITAVTLLQSIFPELLITSLAETLTILGIYLNLEDPALRQLSKFHKETVLAFATLIENRDNSTGGHVRRTSMYVQLIAEQLRKKRPYSDIITKDYLNNLVKAAPMHDIGKVAIPDAILQKPGKLTSEEFEVMKTHSSIGGKMIRDTFHKLGDREYLEMAYQVATYHHERWNGKGYPEGLAEEDIPLCARIMAVADVFDAISEDRCYRPAIPLEECFKMIEEGRGTDFDPAIVDVFMQNRDKVELIHNQTNLEDAE